MKYLPEQKILEALNEFNTPFHIYDEKLIRENAVQFKKAFGILPGFRNYFAVKALPNPFILKVLEEEGMGADCSSLPELMLAEKAGITGENIMFSSNDTPAEEFKAAKKLGAIINLDDMSHIEFLEKNAGIPRCVCLRYNPGKSREGGNLIIGKPAEAKYGFTKEQLFEGYMLLKKKGVKRFGLHTMIVSNELNEKYIIGTAIMLFEVIAEVKKRLDVAIEFVNLGGGIGIPYRPEQKAVSYERIANGIKKAYEEILVNLKPKIFMECGRAITGPYGWLVARVRHIKHTYKDYVGLDASMANLMRPAIYGAHHHITVVGKEKKPHNHRYDVTGSLCENNDKFAIDRMLPEIREGDVIVIHDTGAHGHAMGFNYNGKLRSAELLIREDGSIIEIRRAETTDDYFATLDFNRLKKFK
ncbi:diaminopimelate decarboxylase [Candidatus Woesearchaeota archaeon]|nr:diaminopimelate decarboxylase [Candidatus Woesearchaeota archaeon]